jgi:ribonuclease HI
LRIGFLRNLGIYSNNKAEAYALFQGVQLVKKRKISILYIVGDSKNTIHYFVSSSSPKDIGLNKLVELIRISLLNLKVQLFHIYYHHNAEADAMANKAIGLNPNHLGMDGEEHVVNPPYL